MSKGHLGSEADTTQKRKEFLWIKKNLQDAKTPEQERKWRKKLDNWRRANPIYARVVDQALDRIIKEKLDKMTLSEQEAYMKELEAELERREKVMKDDR